MVMSQHLKVSLLQLVSCDEDQAANLKHGESDSRLAKAMGADIAIFPEMCEEGRVFMAR
jgi:predicted amidohydrolase